MRSICGLLGQLQTPAAEGAAVAGASAGVTAGATPGVPVRRLGGVESKRCKTAVRQLLDMARDCGLTAEQVWGYEDKAGQFAVGLLVAVQQGRTAMLFASPITRRSEAPLLTQVIGAACAGLGAAEAGMAQALLLPTEDLQVLAFGDAGFFRLADLTYMELRVPAHSPRPETPAGVQLEGWRAELEAEFIAVLDASYRQTLDCPALQGMRSTADVLAGHMGTGKFDPELWTLLRVDGKARGVLLLNPVPAATCVELVYLGLAPEQRGKQLGALLMRHGLWLCGQKGQRSLTLAVDEANAPAMRLYRSLGFARTARRVAMMKKLGV